MAAQNQSKKLLNVNKARPINRVIQSFGPRATEFCSRPTVDGIATVARTDLSIAAQCDGHWSTFERPATFLRYNIISEHWQQGSKSGDSGEKSFSC